MAAPAYTTDLFTLDPADTTTGWTEPTTPETGGGLPQNGTEFFIEGSACVSKACAGAGGITGGALYDEGAGVTVTADDAVYTWLFFAAPNTLLDRTSGGFSVCMGSGLGAYRKWYVLGKDNYQYGGWQCIAVDPAVAGSLDIGTPSGTLRYFGAVVKTSATISKGEPFGIDAIRHGRTLQTVSGSVADGLGLFTGAAAANDHPTTGRWGIFQAIPGGYQLQGRFLLGTAGTAVDFRDSNTSVLIANTLYVTAGFNVIEIRNASSRVDWTSVSFQALGTVSRGNFTVTNDADVNWDGCSFTDVGLFSLLANTTATNCVFRRTDKITTGGATLTGCTIDSNRATTAVLASTPANAEKVSNCDFTSDGTGHGLEITGTAANMALTNCTWAGYTAASGGNEAVYINITEGSMTLTITGGTEPSVRTAGCSVTVATSSRTVKVAVNDIDGTVTGANVFLVAAAGGPFPSDAAITSITRSGTTATVTHTAVHGMATNDQVLITGITDELTDNGVHTITYINTTQYSYTTSVTGSTSYTGTKKGTFVFLKGLATAGTGSNEISMSRSIPSTQPVTGWARKSSDPYYKQGAISGEVSSTGDTTFSPVLISDD